MNLIKKYIVLPVNILIVSIFASQCFAQSQTPSADIQQQKTNSYLSIINKLFYFIQQNYVEDVDPQILYEGALRGMFESLDDPYSVYMDKSEWRSISDTTNGSFGGVGLQITKPTINTKDRPAYVEVVQPIDDTPGAKAGIQPGDLLIKIDGTDTSTITMDEVLGLLRGTPGEDVVVTVKRKSVEFTRTLTRAIIVNPTVKYGMIGNSGYIRISEFSTTTAADVQTALDSFKNEPKINGVIIDLRTNGGGLLSAAVDIADKFIDKGIIVSTKSRVSADSRIYPATPKVVWKLPVIVLVNRASASASEILTGALKDTKKAYIMGERTYGKGSVQIPSGLLDNDGFKITVARYYSPTDINIDKKGIEPDETVSYPEFSEEGKADWERMEKDDVIQKYVDEHPDMTEKEIAAYAEVLQKTYKIEPWFLRKIIRNHVDRTKPSRLYDLDYDIQLNKAVEVLSSGNWNKLMKSTETLKEQYARREAEEKENEGKSESAGE
ncbi:MAG: S41 family peptidase [Treponema sp.]|nr:S41 family peptidase [Treponema sp.]